MLTLDSLAFQELRRDFNEWLPKILVGKDRWTPPHPVMFAEVERFSVYDILRAVAKRASCRVADLTGPRRTPLFARPRQIGYLLASELLPHMSLPQIARVFGRCDHTTILYGIRAAKKLIAENDAWREFYESVKGEF